MIYAIRGRGQNCQSMRKMWTLTLLKIVESWKDTPNTIIYLAAGKYLKLSKDLGMQIPTSLLLYVYFYLCVCLCWRDCMPHVCA